MKKYKKYSLWFIGLVGIVVLFHLIIWNTITKHIFPKDHDIGDLGRMSYKLDSLLPRKNINTLNKKHFNFDEWDGKSVDILTIGDSFSNGSGGGKNTYYQDYLSSNYSLNILNIQNIKPANNYLETIYMLNNSHLLDKIKPKIIIVESTESEVLNRFSIDIINKNINMNQKDLINLLKRNKYKTKKVNIDIINNLNFNALKYTLLFNYDDNAYGSNCYISKLNKNLFSSKDSKSLLFYKQTIPYNKSITKESINKLNENLNDLATMLKDKGIKLYFMPAVDKFNLYSKYIVNNVYPKNTFFEHIRYMKKEYKFIDTKSILEREIDKGVKDIFYPDDTHWSYKASEAISKSLQEVKRE